MARKRIDPDLARAIVRNANYRGFDKYARKQYGLPGVKLLARLVAGEAGGQGLGPEDRKVGAAAPGVSSAGARGPAQFIPSTRAAYIEKYGLDPWKNNDQAIKAAIIHIMGTGLAGYNPGMSTYTNYILSQRTTGVSAAYKGRLNMGGGRQLAKFTPGTVSPGGTETDFGAAILDKFLSGDKRPLFQTLVGATEDPAYTTTTPPSRTPPTVKYKVGAAGPGDVLRASGQIRKDGWKGAKSAGEPLASIGKQLGLQFISEKRGTRNTASGGVSDHFEGNKDSYAWDMSNGSSPTKEMDAAALRIARSLGAEKQWRKMGRAGVLNITRKIDGRTYRFQMLYRTNTGGNHFNHVHLGVDRVDTPG